MSTPQDGRFPVSEIPSRLRTRTHMCTVMRWILRGVGNPRVRLAATKVGGRWYTDETRLQMFLDALNGGRIIHPASQSGPTDGSRLAAAELDAEGIR